MVSRYGVRSLRRAPGSDAALNQALEESDGKSWLYSRRGLRLLRRGKISAAIEDLETAVRLDPDGFKSRLDLGWALLVGGRPEPLAPLGDGRHEGNPALTVPTLLLRAGVHVKLVSQALGHSGTQLTLDTYSHAQPDLQGEAANMIDRFLVGSAN